MNWSALEAIATAVGAVATIAGFSLAFWQLRVGARQARTKWEDDLTREYREIVQGLPPHVRLGEDAQYDEIRRLMPVFLDYFDLSNQQALLRKTCRVSRDTWEEWREGIRGSLESGAFGKAWSIVQQSRPKLFAELTHLEVHKFAANPPGWKPLPRW